MEAFINRHRDHIVGTVCGFDRVLLRGTIRSISYADGAEGFVRKQGLLVEDFPELAKGYTQKILAHAKQLAKDAGRPYEYLESPSARKAKAREITASGPVDRGLVCVLSCVEPCMTFEPYRNRGDKKVELRRRRRKCQFLYFYFEDREFGLLHVRLQSWFPFSVQVCVNGRSYLASQMDREGIAYERRGNCFTAIGNLPRAQELLSQLNRRQWAKTLSVLARRVNPLLGNGPTDLYGYFWTIRQSEVATDVIFKDWTSLEAVYPALWQHALNEFSTRDVLRFFDKRLTRLFSGKAVADVKPLGDGIRVKHSIKANSIKMYLKADNVLRIETTINDPSQFRVLRTATRKGRSALAWCRMRKGVCDTQRRVEVSVAANGRYLDALAVVGEPAPTHRILDSVSKPVRKDGYRYRPLRPASPDDAALFGAVLRGEHLIDGFTNEHLRAHLFGSPASGDRERRRRSGHVSRKLRLLRAHGLVHKVPGRRLYRITRKGHEVMATALVLRRTDVKLLMPKKAG